MVQYDSYQATAAVAPSLRRWIVGGLFFSLCLHAGLLLFFYRHQMVGFGSAADLPAAPRLVKMKRVTLPPSADLPEQKAPVSERREGKAEITMPSDKPEITEVNIAPQISELPKQTLLDQTKVEMTGLDKLLKNDTAARAEMDRDLTNIAAIIKESPRQHNQPIIPLGGGTAGGGGLGASSMKIQGLDSLDDIISKSGGAMRAGQKAGMPGGALFEYDSFELREEAVGQLKKLGFLIEKNPQATFSIEGHSDSFGSPDYNLRLSEDRAESVKAWLVQNFHIAPERIQTHGFGNTKPLVSADKSKEEQAPNRRVELVVKTNATRH